MKALALLLWVSSHVLLEFVKMSVRNMDFDINYTSHFGEVLYESLNQLNIVFSLVIPRKPWIPATKLFQVSFSVLFSSLANSSHYMIFLICSPTKIPALTFASDCFGKRSWGYLKAAVSLSSTVTNCLMMPILMCCSGGIITFWGSTSSFHLMLLFPRQNSVGYGQSFLR